MTLNPLLQTDEPQVPSRSATGRYAVDSRSDSPQHSATPPRSPNKPLPTAPDPVTRIATSQKYIKTSVSRSASNSPHQIQSATGGMKPALKKDTHQSPKNHDNGISPRNVNVGWAPRSPDPSRSGRSPTPDKFARTHESAKYSRSPNMGLGLGPSTTANDNGRLTSSGPSRSAKSPEPRRNVKSPEPQGAMRSAEPHQRIAKPPEHLRGDSQEPIAQYKTPAQVMAQMADASKGDMLDPSLSRRRSLTERTRSLLGRRYSASKTEGIEANETNEKNDDTSALRDYTIEPPTTALPIQSPVERSESKEQPNSDIVRRRSSRRNNQMSMSAYSESPVSQMRPGDTPPPREASPQHYKDGQPVPAQSSYGSLSLLPTQPQFSPLQSSFSAADIESLTDSPAKSDARAVNDGSEKRGVPPSTSDGTTKTPTPAMIPALKSNKIPDDSEGNVNAAHPLLREERHARFATRTTPGTPGIKSPHDLPLRHYHSQTNLTQSRSDSTKDQNDGFKAPRRSSSLLYTPEHRITQPTFIEPRNNDQLNSSSNQVTPNASALNLPRTDNLPPETELGIHPAHRTPETKSGPTMNSSPTPSDSSSTTEQGATPPPISTGPSHPSSPPSRFAPKSAPRPLSPDDSQSPQRNIDSNSPNTPNADGQAESTDPKQTPFYLNPASSSALVDFLATTPPPSPPHGVPRGTMSTEPGTPQTASTTGFFNRPFIPRNNVASPPPPAPGVLPRAPWSASTNDLGNGSVNGLGVGLQKKTSGWKKVFGGSKMPKDRKERTGKRRINWGKDATAEGLEGLGFGNGKKGDKEKDRDGDFMGVGNDGVWISRKNFVRG